MNINQEWINRQTESNESRRTYERERLSMWVLDDIAEAMEKDGISKADLARTLGTSRSYVTQVFAGTRNITLGTLADFAWACGRRASVKFEPLRFGDFISSPVMVVEPVRTTVVDLTQAANGDEFMDEIEFIAECGGR